MASALPAFCAEAFFYVAAGFSETRNWLARIPFERAQAVLLWVSALVPYLIFSVAAGTLDSHAFYLLAGLTAVLSFWYAVLPQRFAYDFGFLVIAAAPVFLRVFGRIYRSPDPHMLRNVDILGHLMWIRVGIVALLVLRGWNPGPFSFWPRLREWKSGLFYYALTVIPVVVLALSLRDVRFEPLHGAWWQIAGVALGTFFGMLWVVALSEELFFRGFVERALLDYWRSPAIAIAVSALIYGCAHLPNWRHAVVVTVLGLALGSAYWRDGSVRSPMVTHALVITTWRVLFKTI